MSARLMDGVLLVVTAIALATRSCGGAEVGHSSTADHRGHHNCSGLGSCGSCVDATAAVKCGWALELQACVVSGGETTGLDDGLTVHSADECPTVSAVSPVAITTDDRTVYVLRAVGSPALARYLLRAPTDAIECQMEPGEAAADEGPFAFKAVASETADGVNVTCAVRDDDAASLPAGTYRVRVTAIAGDVWLRPDEPADEYVTVYEDGRCADVRDEHCDGCAWTDAAGRAHYLACAPRDRSCPTVRHGDGGEPRCPGLSVASVVPSTGPRTGGTRVAVAVARAAWGYGDGRVRVTVDGRPCADPDRLDNGTVTCTVPPAAPGARAAATAAAVVVHLDDGLRLTWDGRYEYVDAAPTTVTSAAAAAAAARPVRFCWRPSLWLLAAVAVTAASSSVVVGNAMQ